MKEVFTKKLNEDEGEKEKKKVNGTPSLTSETVASFMSSPRTRQVGKNLQEG